MVDFKSFHRVADREEGSRQGTEARTDLLNGLGCRFRKGMSDDRGEGGFGQKVLAQLAKGAEATGGQNVADLGRVQS